MGGFLRRQTHQFEDFQFGLKLPRSKIQEGVILQSRTRREPGQEVERTAQHGQVCCIPFEDRHQIQTIITHMSSRIAIFGDSWACGEWMNYRLVHRGLAFFLIKKGHRVVNFSQPKASNFSQFHFLKKQLSNNFDWIIFMLTQPFRDFNTGLRYMEDQSYYRNCQRAEDNIIKWLASIEKSGKNLVVVNGLFEKEKVKDFKHHISFTELLIPGKSLPKHYANPGDINQWTLQEKKFTIDKSSILNDFQEDEQNFEKFVQILENNKFYFYPDGRHPNRRGHLVLSNKILSIINGH